MRSTTLLLVLTLLLLLPVSLQAADNATVQVLEIQGPVTPATSDYIARGLTQALDHNVEVVILRMDTPGGLDTSMRHIIKSILSAPVPVVTFVAPSGARAASAGAYILYASHVAAMAPGTNVGAATPVQLGGIPDPGKPMDKNFPGKGAGEDEPERGLPEHGNAMQRKMVNDAAAYIRSLAQMRGRNEDWAELAVRSAASLPAEKALQENVIDLIAIDMNDLLIKLDGREVSLLGQQKVLRTAGLVPNYLRPDWRTRMLAIIADPNVAYILMLIGIYGLFFELANPGFVLPGVVGAICLILALFAFQVLPVNYAGVALILLGILFMVGEVFVPSFGALGLGGLVAFVVGSIILFRDTGADFGVSLPLIGSFAVVSGGFFLGTVGMAVRARKRPVVTGKEEMIGALGEVLEGFSDTGRIHIHGEVWSADTKEPVVAGQKVRVIARHGLVLRIKPYSED